MENITIIYPNVQHGDWVRCNNCGNMMLLPYGSEICPECGFNGALAWVDEEHQEMDCENIPNGVEFDRTIRTEDVFDENK